MYFLGSTWTKNFLIIGVLNNFKWHIHSANLPCWAYMQSNSSSLIFKRRLPLTCNLILVEHISSFWHTNHPSEIVFHWKKLTVLYWDFIKPFDKSSSFYKEVALEMVHRALGKQWTIVEFCKANKVYPACLNCNIHYIQWKQQL